MPHRTAHSSSRSHPAMPRGGVCLALPGQGEVLRVLCLIAWPFILRWVAQWYFRGSLGNTALARTKKSISSGRGR